MKSLFKIEVFRILLIIIFLFSFVFKCAFALERFSYYETQLFIKPPFIEVKKTLIIENLGQVGIVPGELVFRILNLNASSVINVSAKDEFGNIFPTQVKQGQGFVEILAEDYIPIFAKSKQKVYLSYTIKFQTKSLLFYYFEYPLIDTSLPIANGKLIVKTPKFLYITYAPDAKCSKKECYWEFKNSKKEKAIFEISYVPFPRLKVPASNIFWYGIISLIIIIIGIRFLISKLKYRRRYF